MLRPILIILLYTLAIHCAKKGNAFDCEEKTAGIPCDEADPLEKAKQHLNNNEPDAALELLATYQQEHVDDYSYYPLWSSAYAMRAGLDIFNIVNVANGQGSNIFDTINSFLPDPSSMIHDDYLLALEAMSSAKETLESMPEDQRTDTETYTYAASALMQLTLYTSAYAVMYLNQFVLPDPNDPSAIDLDQLQSMSAEDAALILESLATAIAANPDSPLNSQIQSTLDTIDGQSGDTSRDRLVSYIEASRQ